MRVTLLMSVLMLAAACSPEEASPPPMGAPPVTVAHPVAHHLVEWDRYVGRIRAVQDVEVRARVSGYLHSIHFREGAVVDRGDLLFVIDERPFVADLRRAEAGVAEAKAQGKQASAMLTQAQAERAEAEAQNALASSRLERARKALTTNAISKEEVDVRESELTQTGAGLEAARARIASAEAAIATADAAVATAEAALERARVDLSYCRIHAPISGRIDRHEVSVGNLIEGGALASTTLTTIVSLDPIHCEFDASERDFLKYVRLDRTGKRKSSREVRNPVFAALADEKGYPHEGHIDFVANRIDRATGSIRGRAIFPNPDGILTPGLFMTVQIPGSARYEAILIPDRAVVVDQAEQFVLVAGDGDVVERRNVVLGPLSHALRIVRSGLTVADRVIVDGLQLARPGTPVTPQLTEIEVVEDDAALPDDYEPVPREKWLTLEPAPVPAESGR